MSTSYGSFRLSDGERNEAVSALSSALGEGRLSLDEFDRRCEQVAEAEFLGDLEPIFRDIPQAPAVRNAPNGDVALYSAQEIAATRRAGQKIRSGVFWLGTFGSIAGTAIAATTTGSGLSALLLLIIPTLFVLLYVMKVGPASWYTPSVRQLDRQRRRMVRVQQLEIQTARAHEEAQRRDARKQQVNQLTNDALEAAQRTVNRFKDR